MQSFFDLNRRYLAISLVIFYVLTLVAVGTLTDIPDLVLVLTSAVFVITFAVTTEVYVDYWYSTQERLEEQCTRYRHQLRPLEDKVVQLEQTLQKTQQQLELCSEYRLLLLSLLTNQYPSGLRYEYYVTEEHEFAWFLYIDLPPELPLRQHQLRFQLSEHEELILRHLKTYEGKCTVASDSEVRQTLNEYIAIAGYPIPEKVSTT